MKKSCFIKGIIILTIFVAAILYIIQNHLNDFVIDPAKKIFSNIFVSGVDEELNFIRESSEKDSLRTLLKIYLQDKMTKTKELSDKDLDWLVDSVKEVVKDSVITNDDLNKIKNLIEQKDYERPEEN